MDRPGVSHRQSSLSDVGELIRTPQVDMSTARITVTVKQRPSCSYLANRLDCPEACHNGGYIRHWPPENLQQHALQLLVSLYLFRRRIALGQKRWTVSKD